MNKRLIALITAAFLLTGCQLAQPEETEVRGQDRMVGVLVTRESLGLIDMEGYLNDNLDQVLSGEELVVEGAAQYSGRLEAVKNVKTRTGEDGTEWTDVDFTFEGVDGRYFAFFFADSGIDADIAEGEGYWTSVGDPVFCDVHTGLDVTDEGEMIAIEATIYVDQSIGNVGFHYNPIYQTADGRFYAVEGSGSSFQADLGGRMTHTMKEEVRATWSAGGEEGETENFGSEIKITVQGVKIAESVRLLHMSADNQVLEEREYAPDDVPEWIEPAEGTAYLICETRILDENGQTKLTRQIQDAESGPIVFYQRYGEDGICVSTELQIDWPEE